MRPLLRNVLLAALCALAAGASAQTQPQAPAAPRGYLKKVAAAAMKYKEDGDAKSAIVTFEALVLERSDDFDANAWLGYLRLMDGQNASALTPLKRARAARPQDMGVVANMAVANTRLGQWSDAAMEYGRLAEAFPEDASIWGMLGHARLKAGDAAGAVQALEKSDTIKPDQNDVLSALASAYIATGKEDMAERLYTRMYEAGMGDADQLAWLGYRRLQAQQYADAAATLAKANEVAPGNATILNNLAYAYAMMEPPKTAEAVAAYRQLVQASPDVFEPHYNLSSMLLQQGDFAGARDAASAALRIQPDEPFAENNLGRAFEGLGDWASAAAHYGKASDARPSEKVFARNAAVAAMRARKDADAKKYIDRAVRAGDDDPDLKAALAEIYVREGRTQEALALLGSAPAGAKNAAAYWFNMGVTRAQAGDRKGAIDAYKKCLEFNPGDLDATKNLALALAAEGRHDEALPLFRKLSTGTSSVEAKSNYAAALAREGDMDGAIQIWREIVRGNPDQHTVRLNLANALWAKGDHATARFHFATVLKARPSDPNALNGVGLWHLMQSENAQAEAMFRKAVANGPGFVTAYNNLAITLERLNRRKEAIAVLEKALKVDPGYQEAQANLKRMKAAQG